MKQLKLMLTAIVAVFGLFAFRTQPAQGGNFNFRHIFAALCLSATLGIGNIASAEDDLSRVPGTGHYGNTIHGAAMKGLDIWVRHFLILNKDDLNAKAENSRTPLHIAARHNKIESVTELLKWGADVEVRERYGKTPLHFAAAFSDPNIIRALIKAEADIDAKDNYDSTPLHFAAAFGGYNNVRTLVKAGADINARDKEGRTPMFWAVDQGNHAAVKGLVELGASAKIPDNAGRIPFNYAIHCLLDDVCWSKNKHKNQPNAAAHIIEDWALKFSDNEGAIPLHHAAAKGQTKLAIALVKKGADIEKGDGWKRTPLHQAALHNKIETARALIEEGANVGARDKWTNRPLELAIENNFHEMAQLLRDGIRKQREKREKAAFDARVKKWEEWAAKATVPEIEKKWAYCHYVQLHPGFLCFLWSFGW